MPALVISSSSSVMSSSKSVVSCPAAAAASRCCWASARSTTHHCWSSVAGSGVMSGSSSRCQPSRHCAARSDLARSAQAGQTEARVCPQGTSTVSVSPVSRLVRRSCTGRMHAPCSTARSRTTWRASGIAIRCARVVLPVAAVVSVTGHPDPGGRHHDHLGGRWPRCRTSRTGGTQSAVAPCRHQAAPLRGAGSGAPRAGLWPWEAPPGAPAPSQPKLSPLIWQANSSRTLIRPAAVFLDDPGQAPPMSPREPGPSSDYLSGGSYCLTVSTTLARTDATAPFASGLALPLHWPLCLPEVYLGSKAAK